MKAQEPAEINMMILKIIWAGLFMSQFVYSFLVYTLYGAPVFVAGKNSVNLSVVFSIAALSSVLAGFLVFHLLAKPVKQTVSFEDAKQKYFVPFVIRLALIEACSILGFAYSSMVEKNFMLYFSLIALVSFLFCFPTEVKIKKLMRS